MSDDVPEDRRAEQYQGESFEVRDVVGGSIEECIALGTAENGNVEKLIFRIARLGARECYLDAFIGFWHTLDDELLSWVLEAYAGLPRRDLARELDLNGAHLRAVRCERTDRGVVLEIATTRGMLRLVELDPHDPDSEARLEWRPL